MFTFVLFKYSPCKTPYKEATELTLDISLFLLAWTEQYLHELPLTVFHPACCAMFTLTAQCLVGRVTNIVFYQALYLMSMMIFSVQ